MALVKDKHKIRVADFVFALTFALGSTAVLSEFSYLNFPRKTFVHKGDPQAGLFEILVEFEWDKKGDDGLGVLEIEMGRSIGPGRPLRGEINGYPAAISTSSGKRQAVTFPNSFLLQGKNQVRISSENEWTLRRLRIKNIYGYSKGLLSIIVAPKFNRYESVRMIKDSPSGIVFMILFFLLVLAWNALPGVGRWAAIRKRRGFESLRWIFTALLASPVPIYFLSNYKVIIEFQSLLFLIFAVGVLSWVSIVLHFRSQIREKLLKFQNTQAAKTLNYFSLIMLITIMVLPFFSQFLKFHISLPDGCDQFGYLNTAKAISSGRLFKSHSQRPFDEELLNDLKNSYCDYKSYAFVIAPHAYHLDPHRFKVINQYPPGTGGLLSLFPIHARKVIFPALCAFLLIIFLLLAFRIGSAGFSTFHLQLMVIIVALVYLVPVFSQHLGWINSVAPTLGILIAAGYLLEKKPLISILLLGLSTVFRLANIILFVPFLIIYMIKERHEGNRFYPDWTKKILNALLLVLAGGFGIDLLYAWILLGNPFRSTYAYYDLQSSLKAIPENVFFFFSIHQPWFIIQVIILILILLTTWVLNTPKKWLAFSLLIFVFNYSFYLPHVVKIDYYPYASAMVMLGILVCLLESAVNKKKLARLLHLIAIPIVLWALSSSIAFWKKGLPVNIKATFQNQVALYRDCFSRYDVIWGEERTGTIEYATEKAAFRYGWAPPEVRDYIMRWLASHGYRQAIWKDDLEAQFPEIEKNLDQLSLRYEVRRCPELGTVLEID